MGLKIQPVIADGIVAGAQAGVAVIPAAFAQDFQVCLAGGDHRDALGLGFALGLGAKLIPERIEGLVAHFVGGLIEAKGHDAPAVFMIIAARKIWVSGARDIVEKEAAIKVGRAALRPVNRT